MKQYTIGIDYGSLSARGVMVNTSDGEILSEVTYSYPHGAITGALPDGTPLADEWVLQHPGDFLNALEYTVPALLRQSGVDKQQVIAIGVDFTASTVIPLDESFVPLCFRESYASEPHAWPKMWKHHASQPQANLLTGIAAQQGRPYLGWYGGQISRESLQPKVLQTWQEAPEVFRAAACFAEAGDYLTSLLAGKPVCGIPAATAKAIWNKDIGYPDDAYYTAVSPALAGLPGKKLLAQYEDCVFGYPGQRVGDLCPQMAQKLGLCPGIAVTAFQMDGYAAVPAVGMIEPGTALLVIGTSTGVMVIDEKSRDVKGVTANISGGFYPGLQTYASGQASVGDSFQWFMENCLPESYAVAARQRGQNIHDYLSELAAALAPGESGMIGLEWFNGSKAMPDKKLSGVLLGMTMQTRPEHIYRTLLEATAFGVRNLLENHENAGVSINHIIACGGIANKNPLMMQIYADVLGKPIAINSCTQAPALGTAIYAAAAAEPGDFREALKAAVKRMHAPCGKVYTPDIARAAKYDKLYAEYIRLSDYFSGENAVMDMLASGKHGSI